MGLFVRLAWWKMSESDRVEMVEALLRNRAIMLDQSGRPIPGLSIFPGVVPTDEEFTARARTIAATTGKDQRAALKMIDAFGDDVMENFSRFADDLAAAATVAQDAAAPSPHTTPDSDDA